MGISMHTNKYQYNIITNTIYLFIQIKIYNLRNNLLLDAK